MTIRIDCACFAHRATALWCQICQFKSQMLCSAHKFHSIATLMHNINNTTFFLLKKKIKKSRESITATKTMMINEREYFYEWIRIRWWGRNVFWSISCLREIQGKCNLWCHIDWELVLWINTITFLTSRVRLENFTKFYYKIKKLNKIHQKQSSKSYSQRVINKTS